MTFSYAWMKIKNSELAKTKLLDIQVQKKRAPIMMTEEELQGKGQVLAFEDHEVKQPFKSARLEPTPERKTVRDLYYRAKTTEEYPWNKKPIMVTHLYAQHNYVIPRKTRKQLMSKTPELIVYCPALRPKTKPSKTKKVGAKVLKPRVNPKDA